MTQTYTHEFQCVYNLHNYPFDKQTCSIDIRTSDRESSTLKLLPKKLWMEQSVDMTLFHMEHWELVYKNESAVEQDGGQVGAHHLAQDLPPENNGHTYSFLRSTLVLVD